MPQSKLTVVFSKHRESKTLESYLTREKAGQGFHSIPSGILPPSHSFYGFQNVCLSPTKYTPTSIGFSNMIYSLVRASKRRTWHLIKVFKIWKWVLGSHSSHYTDTSVKPYSPGWKELERTTKCSKSSSHWGSRPTQKSGLRVVKDVVKHTTISNTKESLTLGTSRAMDWLRGTCLIRWHFSYGIHCRESDSKFSSTCKNKGSRKAWHTQQAGRGFPA